MIQGLAHLYKALADSAHDLHRNAYERQQRAAEDAMRNAMYADIERAQWGKDAIDVEVREVPDVLLIEVDNP